MFRISSGQADAFQSFAWFSFFTHKVRLFNFSVFACGRRLALRKGTTTSGPKIMNGKSIIYSEMGFGELFVNGMRVHRQVAVQLWDK